MKLIKEKGFLIMSYPLKICHWVYNKFFPCNSDHSVTCSWLNNFFVSKPSQQFVYRNWRKFNPEFYVAVLNFSKENHPADVDSAWNNYLATEETVLETLIPHKTRR